VLAAAALTVLALVLLGVLVVTWVADLGTAANIAQLISVPLAEIPLIFALIAWTRRSYAPASDEVAVRDRQRLQPSLGTAITAIVGAVATVGALVYVATSVS
jgi:hypothetical protein